MKSTRVSITGQLQNVQEVVDLCAEKGLKVGENVVVEKVEELGRIFEELDAGNDSGVRYVLDIAGSLQEDRVAEIGRDCKQPVLDGGFRPVGLCGVVWEAVKLRWRGR